MSKVVFKSYNQNDNLLFPPCLGDFIAENDQVRVLNAVVDHLDIRVIENSYEGGGASSYNPRVSRLPPRMQVSVTGLLMPQSSQRFLRWLFIFWLVMTDRARPSGNSWSLRKMFSSIFPAQRNF